MTACRCQSLDHVWWHIRLIYVLICALVVIYGCSVTWMLTTGVLDGDCTVHCQGYDHFTDQDDVTVRVSPEGNRRVKRSRGRRRSSPAFYRDPRTRNSGSTVDNDEWVWMSTYSKIPVSICMSLVNGLFLITNKIRGRHRYNNITAVLGKQDNEMAAVHLIQR